MRYALFRLLARLDDGQATLIALPWLQRLFTPSDAPTLADRPEWQARWLAATLLGAPAVRDTGARTLLLRLADDPERFVREGTAKAIARWLANEPASADVLANILADPDESRRRRRTMLTAAAALIRDTDAPVEPACTLLRAAVCLPRDDVVRRPLPRILRELARRDPEAARKVQARPWPENWQTTAELPIPPTRLEQVIGQSQAVDVVRLAARQRRFVLLVGEPGTGKSMLADAMTDFLATDDVQDVLVRPNEEQPVSPRVETAPAGTGSRKVVAAKERVRQTQRLQQFLLVLVGLATLGVAGVALITDEWRWTLLLAGLFALLWLGRRRHRRQEEQASRVLVQQHPHRAPFVDATGFHAGALLGDVRHDPFQSGGRETPPHHLVEAGAIHQAHGGVLFIDEVSTLSRESQQALLTAIQEKQMPITGRSPASSGSMVRTAPVPCDAVLVLAGNHDDVAKMHPALRSRMRGFGYEVLMNTEMPDTQEHRRALARFVAQEVEKDGRIPHLSHEAVTLVIDAARRRASPGNLTCRLRDLGGLVRAAGDQAVADGSAIVWAHHVEAATRVAQPLEDQGLTML